MNLSTQMRLWIWRGGQPDRLGRLANLKTTGMVFNGVSFFLPFIFLVESFEHACLNTYFNLWNKR